MEDYARRGSETNTVDDYWCALADLPILHCLDIAAPSTLNNSLNQTAFDIATDSVFRSDNLIWNLYQTADGATDDLFGQAALCDGKRVGDGLINVYDLATLLSAYFGEYRYGALYNTSRIATVQGRDGLAARCGASTSRADYMQEYSQDACVHMAGGGAPAAGRRLDALDWRRDWEAAPAPQSAVPAYAGPEGLARLPAYAGGAPAGERATPSPTTRSRPRRRSPPAAGTP